MQKLLLAGAVLIALTGAPAAYAADVAMPVKAPVMTKVCDWTGFYLGANAGYGWGGPAISFATPAFLPAGATPTSLASNPHGFLGGIQAGYNYQSGRMVYGIETDIDYAGTPPAA